jgi:hypothetical protein
VHFELDAFAAHVQQEVHDDVVRRVNQDLLSILQKSLCIFDEFSVRVNEFNGDVLLDVLAQLLLHFGDSLDTSRQFRHKNLEMLENVIEDFSPMDVLEQNILGGVDARQHELFEPHYTGLVFGRHRHSETIFQRME